MSSDVAKRESAAPRQLGADEDFDVEVDVIVVGGTPAACRPLCSRAGSITRSCSSREGAGARRHGQQGGLLVLGPEQRAHARARAPGRRGRLLALLRASGGRTIRRARRWGWPSGSTTRAGRSTKAHRRRPSYWRSVMRSPTATARPSRTTGQSSPRTPPQRSPGLLVRRDRL
jgi:hypothetical protein